MRDVANPSMRDAADLTDVVRRIEERLLWEDVFEL